MATSNDVVDKVAARAVRIANLRSFANTRVPREAEHGRLHGKRTRGTTQSDRPDLPVHAPRVKRRRPADPKVDNSPVSGYVKIGSVYCHTLVDTGSEGDMLTHETVKAEGSQSFDLDPPVPLQLATSGGKSKIHKGIYLGVCRGKECLKNYFDIVNLDYYDAVLGIPFTRAHGILVDPKKNDAFYEDGTSIFAFCSPPTPVKLSPVRWK
jgi:hypothetical protein